MWSKWMYKLSTVLTQPIPNMSLVSIAQNLKLKANWYSNSSEVTTRGINRTYNSNSTAWEFQIYWRNAENYRTKGCNKISSNRWESKSVANARVFVTSKMLWRSEVKCQVETSHKRQKRFVSSSSSCCGLYKSVGDTSYWKNFFGKEIVLCLQWWR